MFYELSIQYDDPIFSSLVTSSGPASELIRSTVTKAFPNWIPASYPSFALSKMVKEGFPDTHSEQQNDQNQKLVQQHQDEDIAFVLPTQALPFPNGELSEFMNLTYHRYLHLFYIYLDEYVPSDVLAKSHSSFVSSVVKILSPLAPQGNWTNGGTPPQPNEFFYRSFPKQATNFDNDYHVSNPGVFWGWFYLSRWLPDLIQNVLFPLDNVVYSDNTGEKIKSECTDNISATTSTNARKLMGNQTPTKLECLLCEKFNGMKVWNRNGEWFCIYKDKIQDLESQTENREKLSNKSQYDSIFFKTFNEMIEWKINYTNQIKELERKAFSAKNMTEMREIEKQIQSLRERKQSSTWFKSNYIVSVKG